MSRALALALWFLACGLSSATAAEPAPLQTVPQVDLQRYMGRWYEIAKFPNWFQKKCSVGPAQLEVRFAPAWLGFLPFLWGNYWVIDLDPDYQLVAVSEPQREYLWVLSRTPQVDAATYQALLGRLRAQGLDTERLELTSHQPNKP
jgi:apolipoprotein D and lipocalin family protein